MNKHLKPLVLSTLSLCILNANTTLAQSSDEGPVVLEEVTVLATRRDTGRSALDAAVPIDVISESELQAQGNTDMIDVLTNVVPSFNANREPISDAGSLVRPANLRGMPSDNTLVLVNGKRRHRGAVIGEFIAGVNRGAQGVDLNPLFGAAVKQVGVLRDGAAAQYGSDAIAGV
jgi:iron complex outermembrane receptor protein